MKKQKAGENLIEITEDFLSKTIKKRPAVSHKGNFGRVVLIGGNRQYGGAIIMSAESCLKSGAGLVTVITDEKNHFPLHCRLPEAMALSFREAPLQKDVLENADVILIGPGLGLEYESLALLTEVLLQQTENQWLVIDGSAITLFANHTLALNYPEHTVFTPHQMEWQRLSNLPLAQQTLENNQRKQQSLQATIVLKSHRTQIYDGSQVLENTAGNPGMATGGSGDTLAGIIAGFLGQFEQTSQTIAAAVYLHSRIADDLYQENYVVLPTSISAALPHYMKKYAQ